MIDRWRRARDLQLQPISEEDFRELAASDPEAVIIGDLEDADSFWRGQSAGSTDCPVLLAHEDYHLDPALHRLGVDTAIAGVDEHLHLIERSRLATTVQLPCRFYEVVYWGNERFIVENEIGFTCFSYRIEELWEWSGDLINSSTIDDSYLTFETFEGERHRLRIEDGKEGQETQ